MNSEKIAALAFCFILLSIAFIVVKNALSINKIKKSAYAKLADRESMIFVSHNGVVMSIRKEEKGMWDRLSIKQKNAMAEDHKRHVKKGNIVKKGDGFVPVKAIRKDSTKNKK